MAAFVAQERPYNPDKLTLPHCADVWMPNPSASFTLASAIESMGSSAGEREICHLLIEPEGHEHA